MNFKISTIFILLFILGNSSVETYAQNQNITQIRAYISRANAALTNKDWNSALESVNEAQKIAGKNGAVFESVRVRAYFGKKEYNKAKQSMEIFYNLNPSQSAINEIVAYETMIDDEIQEKKDRIARLEQQEKDRIARQQKEEREYEQLLNSIVVGEEAVALANQIRKELERLPTMTNKLRNLPQDIKGTWGREGTWNVAGGYNDPDVTSDFIYRTAYGSTNFDYSLSSEYVRINFTTKFDVFFDSSEDGRSMQQACSNNYSINDKLYNNTKMTHRFSSTSSQPFDRTTVILTFSEISDNDNYKDSSYLQIISCGISSTLRRYQNSINRANIKLVESAYYAAKYRIDDIAKRISMNDRQSIAYAKDKEEFGWYFNRSLYRESPITYRSLKYDLDQKELAKQRRLEAERKKREAARLKKEQYDKLISSADNAFNSGQLSNAKNYYEQAAELYPNESYPKNKIKETDQLFRQRIKDTYEDLLEKGEPLLEEEKYEEALKLLLDAKNLKKDNPEIYLDRNYTLDRRILTAREEIKENKEALEESTALVVDDNEDLKYEKYILQRALKLQPENESFKTKLEQVQLRSRVNEFLITGDEAFEESNLTEALSHYEKALEVMPGLETTIEKINTAKNRLSNKAESKHQLFIDIKSELENDSDKGEEFLQNARQRVLDYVKDYPNDIELLITATNLFIQEKLGLESAFNLANKAYAVDSTNTSNLINMGEILYQSNQTERALFFYDKAWNLGDQDNPEMLRNFGRSSYMSYLRTKDESLGKTAVQIAQHAQELGLDDPVYSRIITRLCTDNTTIPCDE